MPKPKRTSSNILHKYVSDNGAVFKTDGKILFCNICLKGVAFERKFQVDQHLKSQKHKSLVDQNTEKSSQLLFSNHESKSNQFNMALCQAFISADIPLHKLNNIELKIFFQKYINESIPDESTLRKYCVDKLYIAQLNEIKAKINSNFLWISIDETTDIEGRYVANVVVGIMDSDEEKSKQKFLINTVELEKANHETIARAFNDSIALLGECFNKNQILLYVSDAAPYMVKSAKVLKVFYPKMIHVTCLAHAMHRVAEEIRDNFDDIDLLISYGKKIFCKAPSRVAAYKNKYPDLRLPPEPITTRWGTWLEAVMYYAENFDQFKDVVEGFDDNDAVSIKRIKQILNLPNIKAQIVFVSTSYGFISETILKLEESNPLSKQIKLIDDVIKKIYAVEGNFSKEICIKLDTVLEKNDGFQTIKQIAGIFNANFNGNNVVKNKYTTKELAAFKHAPITSVDVERSFSRLKTF